MAPARRTPPDPAPHRHTGRTACPGVGAAPGAHDADPRRHATRADPARPAVRAARATPAPAHAAPTAHGGPAAPAPSPDGPAWGGGDITPELAGDLVQRIFEAGLQLSSASSLVGGGPAGERLAAAVTALDLIVRDVRLAVFSRSAPQPPSPGPA